MAQLNVESMPKKQHLVDDTDEEDQFISAFCAGPDTKKKPMILLNLIRFPNSLQTLYVMQLKKEHAWPYLEM